MRVRCDEKAWLAKAIDESEDELYIRSDAGRNFQLIMKRDETGTGDKKGGATGWEGVKHLTIC